MTTHQDTAAAQASAEAKNVAHVLADPPNAKELADDSGSTLTPMQMGAACQTTVSDQPTAGTALPFTATCQQTQVSSESQPQQTESKTESKASKEVTSVVPTEGSQQTEVLPGPEAVSDRAAAAAEEKQPVAAPANVTNDATNPAALVQLAVAPHEQHDELNASGNTGENSAGNASDIIMDSGEEDVSHDVAVAMDTDEERRRNRRQVTRQSWQSRF